jgi:hypothetical protein
VPHLWQKINVCWLFCHSWQDREWHMITAMTFLILLLLVAVSLAVATVRLIAHDGRGPQRPPASHLDDVRFAPPFVR